MTVSLNEILDDLFQGCALAAYVELAMTSGGVPDEAATRRLAYRYYEEELAAKLRQRSTDSSTVD
jgi:hypothetical protein